MAYKAKELEKILNRKYQTIRVYLSRAEFQHIKVVSIEKERIFLNMTLDDIASLKLLLNCRQCCRYIRNKK
jgi:hypothetical protein